MPFEEPAAVYFEHFQDVAEHVQSGGTITGYLSLDEADVRLGSAHPEVRTDNTVEFQCPRAAWDALHVKRNDELRIRGERWSVDTLPRQPVVARVRLGRFGPDD